MFVPVCVCLAGCVFVCVSHPAVIKLDVWSHAHGKFDSQNSATMLAFGKTVWRSRTDFFMSRGASVEVDLADPCCWMGN